MTQRDIRLRAGGLSFQSSAGYRVRGAAKSRYGVITEKKERLRAFSREGIRGDVVLLTLALAAVVFVTVLCGDLFSVSSGSRHIGELRMSIGSLEDANSRLRNRVSYYQDWSRAVAAGSEQTEYKTVEISLPEN